VQDDTLEGAIDELVTSVIPLAMTTTPARTFDELRADLEDFLLQVVEQGPEDADDVVAARTVLQDENGLFMLTWQLGESGE
jgi:hypothetical protein